MCRASRLRQTESGRPFQRAASSRRSGQAPSRARTMPREVSRRSFIRWTRTAACCLLIPTAAASSRRVSSPATSSHHSESSCRSSSSSQRTASATSRRCPSNWSRRTVSSAKSAAPPVVDSSSGAGVLRRARSRICRMAMATSQDRKLSGSRRLPRLSTARSMVSWTTSSTSAWPFRARPTMLYTSGSQPSTSSSSARRSPSCAAAMVSRHCRVSTSSFPAGAPSCVETE